MVNIKQKVDFLAKKFVPSHRFLRTQESIIDRSHILQTALKAASIKVLNWNIAKKSYNENWVRDFLIILEQYQPDLIFLQEFRLDIDAKNIVELVNMSWSFAPNFIDAHHQSYSGILTAAKISPLHKRAIITKHYEPIIKTPKVSLMAEYPLSHNPNSLLTVNSHLINFVNLHKFKTQLHELELALSTHQGPIIFSGDFNTWNRQRALLLYKVATRLGLMPVSFTPHHSKKIKRFLLSPPLDYIFYRGLKEHKTNARVLEHITSSDHKPLLAEFSYINT